MAGYLTLLLLAFPKAEFWRGRWGKYARSVCKTALATLTVF